MSGTPCGAPMVIHHCAGARWIATYAAMKAYEISSTASHEMVRTPRTPKYSLMTSVITKTTGQISTPAVKLSDPLCPKRFQLKGAARAWSSSAKILTPTNSAISALARKNP